MTKEDLQQIGDLMDNKLAGNNKDLRNEFADLLDVKLDKAFEKNNAILKDEIIAEMGEVISSAFTEFEGRVNNQFAEIRNDLAEVKNQLEMKPNADRIFTWADNILLPVRADNMKLKFLHMTELKNLPDNLTMKSTLIEEGLE